MRSRGRRHDLALGALVDRELPRVWSFARGVLGDDTAAREVTREALRILRTSERDGEVGHVLLLRRARLACRAGAGDPGAPPVAADAPVAGTEPVAGTARVTADALGELDLDGREVVVLLEVLDLSVEETAAICDLAADTVEERHRRGLAHLVGRVLDAAG